MKKYENLEELKDELDPHWGKLKEIYKIPGPQGKPGSAERLLQDVYLDITMNQGWHSLDYSLGAALEQDSKKLQNMPTGQECINAIMHIRSAISTYVEQHGLR